ncbi:MAG: AsmA family protein [bacterium]
MKKTAAVLAGLILLLVIVALVAPFLIDLNRYKPTILAKLRPYIDREVDFKSVELTVLTGLGAEIQGLRIADAPAFSSDDFLNLESVQVRVRVVPLLRKQIQIKSLIIKSPVVRIHRNEAGAFNFEDLLAPREPSAAPQQAPAPAQPEAAEKENVLLAGFAVGQLRIQDGRIVYTDLKTMPGSDPLFADRVDLKIDDVSPGTPIRLHLSAGLMDHSKPNLDLEGQIGPLGDSLQIETAPFEVEMSLQELPMAGLARLFLTGAPVQVLSATAGWKVGASGTIREGVRCDLDLLLEHLILQQTGGGGEGTDVADGGDGRTPELSVNASGKLQVVYPAQHVGIEGLALSVNGNRLVLDGSVDRFIEHPRWDLKAKSENFRPGDLLRLFPMWARSVPKELALDGPLGLSLASGGDAGSFSAQATLSLDDMRIRYGQDFEKAPGIPLAFTWDGEKMASQITVRKFGLKLHQLEAGATGEIILGDEAVRLGLIVQTNSVPMQGWESLVPSLSPYGLNGDLYAKGSIRGTLDNLSANLQANADRLAFRLPAGETSPKGSEPIPGSLEGVSLDVQAKRAGERLESVGDLKIKAGDVRSIRLEKVLGRFRYQPPQLEISGLEVHAFEGAIRATGSMDLESKSWSFKPVLDQIAIGPLLDQLTSYQGLLTGKLSGEMGAEGASGQEPGPGVSARGSLRLSQGSLENFDLVGSVVDALFGVPGVSQFLAGRKGEVAEHQKTQFEYLDAQFDMKDQAAQLSAKLHNVYTSKATDSDALLDGNVALDEKKVDMSGKVILSKKDSNELARQAEVLKALLNTEQRMVLPITVKGSISKPVPFLDTKYVAEATAKYYGRKGLEKLGEQLGLPKSKEEGQKPGEKLLRDLLKQ